MKGSRDFLLGMMLANHMDGSSVESSGEEASQEWLHLGRELNNEIGVMMMSTAPNSTKNNQQNTGGEKTHFKEKLEDSPYGHDCHRRSNRNRLVPCHRCNRYPPQDRGGALIAYLIVGIILYFVMTCLGEMASLLPVPGSFQTFASTIC